MLRPTIAQPRTAGRRRVAAAATAAAVAVALLTAGCSSGSTGTDGAASPSGSTAGSSTPTTARPTRSAGCDADPAALGARSSHERVDVATAGGDRWYNRYVPAGYDGTPAPLVVDLHGYLSGAAGGSAMSNFAPLAEQHGFVLATPQGNSDKPYWNAVPHPDLPDDLGFVEQVMDDMEQDVCVDPSRVYVVGFSNGAFLASLVACRLSDRVAAVAALAGLQRPKDCAPDRPVPLLAVHGTADGYVAFDGGANPRLDELAWNDQSRAAFEGLPFAPVTKTAAEWAASEGCGAEPEKTAVATGIERTTYTGCDGGSTVQLYVVDGAGHTWPGSAFSTASASILGPTSQEMDASAVIWDFFAAHPMPGAAVAPGATDGAAATPAALPAAVQTLDITGTEYTFAIDPAPGTALRPGWTKVSFHNRGAEPHQVMFARLKDGVDLSELAAKAGDDSSGSAAIEFVDMIGGVSYIGPGQDIEALIDLPTGTVLAMCYVPDATGKAHALSGMTNLLTVGADTAPTTGAPAAPEGEPVQGTIELDRDGYRLPDPLRPGWYHVVNRDGGGAGAGVHELSVLGLRSELDDEGLARLLDDLAANNNPKVPLVALGGMGALSGGFDGYLHLDLEPGSYLAVDFMPDPGDPRPHLLDGYVARFRV